MDSSQKTILGGPSIDPNRTLLGAAPTVTGLMANVTQTIKPMQCPVCKSFNPPAVGFCIECGLMLDRALPDDAFGAPVVTLPTLVDTAGREWHIRPGGQTIGRQGDIQIEDARISRRHARISSQDGNILVEDLGSTNGTFLGSERLSPSQPKAWTEGDLSLGGFILRMGGTGGTQKTQMPTGGKTAALTSSPTVQSPIFKLSTSTGLHLDLFEGEHTLGRRDSNNLVVSDPTISGQHAKVRVSSSELEIMDLGSTNGTFIDEARLGLNEWVKWTPGAKIRMGQVEITVSEGAR